MTRQRQFSTTMFQSALPVRGAIRYLVRRTPLPSVSIRAPCEGSDVASAIGSSHTIVFQSALPVRGAITGTTFSGILLAFQSALPVRGAMPVRRRFLGHARVSIRAPCEGSDRCRRRVHRPTGVSIRAPCEGSDLRAVAAVAGHQKFQSALPVRGAMAGKRFGRAILARFNPRSL